MIDWIWPSAGTAQHREESKWEAIPRICEHLANGAKHFILNREHSAVTHLERMQGAFDSEAFEASAFDTDSLLITLDPKEAQELGAQQIAAPALAHRVLLYWRRRMGCAKEVYPRVNDALVELIELMRKHLDSLR